MRARSLIAVVAFVALSGCYRYAGQQISHPVAEAPTLRRNIRTQVVMNDGMRQVFQDATILGDSLYGWAAESGRPRPDPAVIPLSKVSRVNQLKRSAVLSGLIIAAGIILVVIGAIQISRDPFSSF